jgi:YVTN family beta-propeller protein
MRRFSVTAISAAVFLLAAMPAFAGQLLVVCKGAQKLAFFDAGTYKALGTAVTGVGAREVAVSPDGRRAFVANFDDIKNTVDEYNVASRSLVKSIKIAGLYGPHDLEMSRDGKTLFVTCEKSRAVAALDVATGEISRAYRTTMKNGHTLALLPDESHIFVANGYDDNVTVYATKTGEVDRHILVGDHPDGLAARPDGKEVWVPCQGNSELTIIDSVERKVTARVPCPGSPIRVAFTPDSKLAIVTCQNAGRVMFFDTTTREVVGSVLAQETPHGIAIGPGGKLAYVTNAASATVSVIDIAKREVVGTFDTPEIPAGITYVE